MRLSALYPAPKSQSTTRSLGQSLSILIENTFYTRAVGEYPRAIAKSSNEQLESLVKVHSEETTRLRDVTESVTASNQADD